MEEKYNKPAKATNGQYGDKYDEDSESSDEEDEDDEGFLATEELDAQISATLQALRSRDPRVYDEKVTFYKPIDEDAEDSHVPAKKEKPMYLSDYHRENLLKGNVGAEEEEEAPRTFAQEQEDLKRSVVKEMHDAAKDDSEDDDEVGGFLVPKSKSDTTNSGVHPSRAAKIKVNLDVNTADKDPETFLSNFMAARAWVPGESSSFMPFESDDEEEDERAEKFEVAYNLRFEDPAGSNEMLKSYARDVVAAKSVRREEPNSRKKHRDAQREKREAGKKEREEERARLRQLKIGEMEEKLQRIKKAAGIRGKTLKSEEWAKLLDENWDHDSWETEMKNQFGEIYYAEQEAGSEEDTDGEESNKKKKPKKPKWDDDIDIKDLIPDYADDDTHDKPAFTLSESDSDTDSDDQDGSDSTPKKGKAKKDRLLEKQAKRKAARIERKTIEGIVDSHIDPALPKTSLFRYRDTSPTSFGLTARDILMAPDAQLNQFAGLKKMAAFRDPEKKRRDKKRLGKKARLRQWRKETFGNEEEPQIAIDEEGATENGDVAKEREGKRRRGRGRGRGRRSMLKNSIYSYILVGESISHPYLTLPV